MSSVGCRHPPATPLTVHDLLVHDPRLGPVNRSFLLSLPARPLNTAGARLLFAFHGQGGAPAGLQRNHRFDALANASSDPWVVVYPGGMGDGYDSGWNCGTAADDTTCANNATGVHCHSSCVLLGKCGRCNWSTCYDDVAFVLALIDLLGRNLCLDLGQVHGYGESNGAMLVHYLAQELPGRFRAIVPVYGHPLLGYLVGKRYTYVTERAAAAATDILDLQPRGDTVIPEEGGLSAQRWLYEPLPKVVGTIASMKSCDADTTPLQTPYEGGTRNLSCWQHANCSNGGRVHWCDYDGVHGDLPQNADELVWSFLSDTQPAAVPPAPWLLAAGGLAGGAVFVLAAGLSWRRRRRRRADSRLLERLDNDGDYAPAPPVRRATS